MDHSQGIHPLVMCHHDLKPQRGDRKDVYPQGVLGEQNLPHKLIQQRHPPGDRSPAEVSVFFAKQGLDKTVDMVYNMISSTLY